MQTIIPTEDYKEFVEKISELGHRSWVFRGHSQLGWRIESSLSRYLRAHQRNILPKSCDPRENDSIKKFKRSAHQFLSHLPDEKDKLGWLAIMQHFGAPTRLIDFTYSPFVALFFAAADAGPTIQFGEKLSAAEIEQRYRPYEIHGLHLKSLRNRTRETLGKESGDPAGSDYLIGGGQNQEHEFLGFFEGVHHNPRQVAQQGLFLVPSKVELNVEQVLKDSESAPNLKKNSAWVTFQFPGGRDSYKRMIHSLIDSNLTAESLFPGLEGVARSIYQRWYQKS